MLAHDGVFSMAGYFMTPATCASFGALIRGAYQADSVILGADPAAHWLGAPATSSRPCHVVGARARCIFRVAAWWATAKSG
ncbi:MAG: hypothetical protein U1F09_15870 [Steroidobacteraceae bacterium]